MEEFFNIIKRSRVKRGNFIGFSYFIAIIINGNQIFVNSMKNDSPMCSGCQEYILRYPLNGKLEPHIVY